MVLHRANFEIPARFSFRPFSVRWKIETAELIEWEEPRKRSSRILGMAEQIPGLPNELERVVIRIPAETYGGLAELYGMETDPHFVKMHRAAIPVDVLLPHETRESAPDIAGRPFPVLMCSAPEFKASLFPSSLRPGETAKNAWVMRDEFVNLPQGEDEFGNDWVWGLKKFLDKWGLWQYGRGFDFDIGDPVLGFVLVLPHLLRKKREEYRQAMESRNARKWLSTASPLNFTTIENPPFFLVERHYCEDAIQATITIDHLAGRKFGFCKRCGRQFEQETEHKKNYCSRRCIQAAGVQRWRENQRKAQKKGAKHNAKG